MCTALPPKPTLKAGPARHKKPPFTEVLWWTKCLNYLARHLDRMSQLASLIPEIHRHEAHRVAAGQLLPSRDSKFAHDVLSPDTTPEGGLLHGLTRGARTVR